MNTNSQLVQQENQAMPIQATYQPGNGSASLLIRIIEMAVNKPDFDIEKVRGLLELKEQMDANEAKKAFVSDMAEFKRMNLSINKDHHVEFRTDKGITAYDHATIGNVVGVIVPALAQFGFSHRWIIERGEGGLIRVRCVITHRLGHSEETVLEAGLDQTGGKNNIQAMISTKTYLERHSLLAATGLATSDTPDDYDEEEAKTREAATLAAKEAKPKPTTKEELPAYAEADFAKNLPKWRALIESEKKSADDIVKSVSSKARLTQDQIDQIKAKAVEGVVV